MTRETTYRDATTESGSSRRSFLRATAVGSAASIGFAGCLGNGGGTKTPTANDPLKVAVYGGVFKDVLDEALIEPFKEETGIEVQSEANSVGEALVKLKNSVEAGKAPVDVVLIAPEARIRAQDMGVWLNYDPGELSNLDVVLDDFVHTTDDGQLTGVGAFAWFLVQVSYEPNIDQPLTTWEEMWDPKYEKSLGVNRLPGDSFLLNIVAQVFDGYDESDLHSEEGIDRLLQKASEVVLQVGLWWAEEAKAQQALKEGQIKATQMYNDVSLVMKENGAPIQIRWPEEGAMMNHGAWSIVKTTDYPEQAKQFVDYSIQSNVQNEITRNLYTAPTITESELDITDELYEKVYGPGPEAAHRPDQTPYIEHEKYLSEQWNKVLLE